MVAAPSESRIRNRAYGIEEKCIIVFVCLSIAMPLGTLAALSQAKQPCIV